MIKHFKNWSCWYRRFCKLLQLILVYSFFSSVSFGQTPLLSNSPIELLVLGSGGPRAEGRASSSNILLINGKAAVLVDAGSGAFVRSGELKLNIDQLELIFFTHFHIDHSADFPALAKTRAQGRTGTITFNVFGPKENIGHPSANQFIAQMFGPGGVFAYQPSFGTPEKFIVTDLPFGLGTQLLVIYDQQGLKVTTIGTNHGPTPSVAYRFDYQGRSIVFSGDTNPSAQDNLIKLSKNADLLVFNCAILDDAGSTAQSSNRHTPPKIIGKIAHEAQVKQLVLSHIMPIVDQAKDQVIKSIGSIYSGKVIFAEDKKTYPLEP